MWILASQAEFVLRFTLTSGLVMQNNNVLVTIIIFVVVSIVVGVIAKLLTKK